MRAVTLILNEISLYSLIAVVSRPPAPSRYASCSQLFLSLYQISGRMYFAMAINLMDFAKLILHCGGAVGKTHILNRYLRQDLPQNGAPTIGVEYATKIVTTKEGGKIKLQIWDTAGQEKYRASKHFEGSARKRVLQPSPSAGSIEPHSIFPGCRAHRLRHWLNSPPSPP